MPVDWQNPRFPKAQHDALIIAKDAKWVQRQPYVPGGLPRCVRLTVAGQAQLALLREDYRRKLRFRWSKPRADEGKLQAVSPGQRWQAGNRKAPAPEE